MTADQQGTPPCYKDYTVNDRNPLKRFVQRSRFTGALAFVPITDPCSKVIDFGGGDGELSARLAQRWPASEITCYEPATWLREQAEEKLARFLNAKVVGESRVLTEGTFDMAFCLEVFEHLPVCQTKETLGSLSKLLKPDGNLVVSVPVEVFFPALLKGVFRCIKHYPRFETRWTHILRAVAGRPPKNRPLGELSEGLPYHFEHLGFDHRQLRPLLRERFTIAKETCSPFPLLGPWFNSQIYFVCRKRS